MGTTWLEERLSYMPGPLHDAWQRLAQVCPGRKLLPTGPGTGPHSARPPARPDSTRYKVTREPIKKPGGT